MKNFFRRILNIPMQIWIAFRTHVPGHAQVVTVPALLIPLVILLILLLIEFLTIKQAAVIYHLIGSPILAMYCLDMTTHLALAHYDEEVPTHLERLQQTEYLPFYIIGSIIFIQWVITIIYIVKSFI